MPPFLQGIDINLANPNWDTFIYLLFIVGALLYGLSLGRDRVLVILVSVYMSLAVVENAPILKDLNQLPFPEVRNFIMQIGFFLGLFVALFFFLSQSALSHTLGNSASAGPWWQTIVFSILQVGLLISITLSFLPPEALASLTPQTREIFTSYWGKSAWLILPILFMAIAPRSKGNFRD